MSNIEIPDVDLDVKDRERAVSLFNKAIPASQLQEGKLTTHNTGIYFQNIPVDPITGISAFPFDLAEKEFGYFKVDVIPNHVYDLIQTEEELQELLDAQVDWDWFLDERFYKNQNTKLILTHLGNYHDLVCQYPPQSVEDIAILIALIRPRKKYLKGEAWGEIKNKIWKPLHKEKGYFFKKSHAIAFALLVVVHAQLIARRLNRKKEPEGGFFF